MSCMSIFKEKKNGKATVPCSCWNAAFPTPWVFVSVFAEGSGEWLMTQGLLSQSELCVGGSHVVAQRESSTAM